MKPKSIEEIRREMDAAHKALAAALAVSDRTRENAARRALGRLRRQMEHLTEPELFA